MNKLICIAGANQSGKTYTVIHDIIPRNTLKRTLIVNCSCEPDYYIFKEIKRIQDAKKYSNKEVLYYDIPKKLLIEKPIIEVAKSVFAELIQLQNTLIILDDVRNISNANTANLFKVLCVSYAQNNNNVILIYHSVNDIQNDILPHIKQLVIFRTTDSTLRKDFNKQDEITQTMHRVNAINELGYFEVVNFE